MNNIYRKMTNVNLSTLLFLALLVVWATITLYMLRPIEKKQLEIDELALSQQWKEEITVTLDFGLNPRFQKAPVGPSLQLILDTGGVLEKVDYASVERLSPTVFIVAGVASFYVPYTKEKVIVELESYYEYLSETFLIRYTKVIREVSADKNARAL